MLGELNTVVTTCRVDVVPLSVRGGLDTVVTTRRVVVAPLPSTVGVAILTAGAALL